jgi:hypothetical protein
MGATATKKAAPTIAKYTGSEIYAKEETCPAISSKKERSPAIPCKEETGSKA